MAPSRTALLALCLVLAVSAAAAAVQPASKCRSTKKGLLGGWEAVKKVPEEAYQAILINLVENGNSTWCVGACAAAMRLEPGLNAAPPVW